MSDYIQPLSEPGFKRRWQAEDRLQIIGFTASLALFNGSPFSQPDFRRYRLKRMPPSGIQTFVVPAVVVSSGVLFFVDLVETNLR